MNHKLDTDERVFFYEQEFYVLSNFSAFRVLMDHNDYATAEHAYQAAKFSVDTGPWIQIVLARSAHDAARIAHEHADFIPGWEERRLGVMREILTAKWEQHEYVRRKLRETGTRELVEDSWRDNFWGIGPDGDGHNMLGKLWMELRKEAH